MTHEKLKNLKWEELAPIPEEKEKGPDDPILAHGQGITRLFRKYFSSLSPSLSPSLHSCGLVYFTYEGENNLDGLNMASLLEMYLNVTNENFKTQTREWNTPASWEMMFGTPADDTLYL